MNFKLNLVTIALLTTAGMTGAVVSNSAMAFDGYAIQNANTAKVKFKNWTCKHCKIDTGFAGSVTLGAGYNNSDDAHAGNTFATDNQVVGKLDADVNYRGENGYRTQIEAVNLGLDQARFELETGKIGQYKIDVNYREMTSVNTANALTPYQGIGSDYLTLPNGWTHAGTTTDMSDLRTSLNPLELSLNRKRAGIGFEYQSESLFNSHINYQREKKTGLKAASGSFSSLSMMLAEPVDYTNDTLDAGMTFKGSNWLASLNYNGSMFKNQYSALRFDNAFSPTFGAQTIGAMSLDPDNQAHMLSLRGQYRTGSTIVNGTLRYGQMTQDQDFVTLGYYFDTPASSLDGKVITKGANLQVTSKVSNDLRLKANYDLDDRDNQTQVEQWTQIRINNVNGEIAYNTPYDFKTQKAKLAADYRISRDLKLEAGYDYRSDERSYQDRETTHQHDVWATLRVNGFDTVNMWVKGGYGERDGSKYQASKWTSSENNALLRKYYLADRQRTQVQGYVSYSPLNTLTLDLGARYALDDYSKTQIGLTQSTNMSFDTSASYQLTDDVNLTAFYSRENIDSDQAGSNNFVTVNWTSQIEDQVDVVGAGMRYDNLLDKKLGLGLDYTYSDSNSNTQVTQGISGDYGDYFAKVHNVNLYADYKVSKKLNLRADYKMEKYQDNDAAGSIDIDAISNVVSFGHTRHDYTAHLVMLSMSYKL